MRAMPTTRRQLPARFLDGAVFRLVRRHLAHAVRHRGAGRIDGARGGERILIAFQIRASDRFKFIERDIDAFRASHHRREFRRAQRIAVIGRGNGADMSGEIAHRG